MIGFPKTMHPRYETVRHVDGMYQVAPDIVGLRTGISNVYMLGEPGSAHWVLVDAGMPGSGRKIRHAAETRFGPGNAPAAIILTHGHFDHVGGLHDLLAHWNVTVYAHKMELPYLTGRSSYPPAEPGVGGGLVAWLSGFYPSGPIVLGSHVQSLPKDGSVPGISGWHWFHTPGHAPGHISLFRDKDRCLIAGDAFTTVRQESFWSVVAGKPQVHGPPAYFTPDWPAARSSLEQLVAMKPAVVATGHGIPLRGPEMLSDLRRLSGEFGSRVLPRHGRYRDQPASADMSGTVSVPPPVDHPVRRGAFLLALALAGGALGAGLVENRRRERLRRRLEDLLLHAARDRD